LWTGKKARHRHGKWTYVFTDWSYM